MNLFIPMQEALFGAGLDAMLVMSYFNTRYITGGMGGGAALVTEKGRYFFLRTHVTRRKPISESKTPKSCSAHPVRRFFRL